MPIMCKIISPNQASFILGRQIIDNIMIVQEMLHYFNKSKSKKGMIMWKIGLEKAFDRTNWDFLEATLKKTCLSSY